MMTEGILKNYLQRVKVCKPDTDKIEKQIKKELFETLDDRCEVVRMTDIPFKKIDHFINHIGDAFEGIGENGKQKLKTINFCDKAQHLIRQFKFNVDTEDNIFRARYGMVVMAKSGDRVECNYVLYKMDFRIAVSKERSILWGLFRWESTDPDKTAQLVNDMSFPNFFRTKAIEEFYKEGIIESINYVRTINDV